MDEEGDSNSDDVDDEDVDDNVGKDDDDYYFVSFDAVNI